MTRADERILASPLIIKAIGEIVIHFGRDGAQITVEQLVALAHAGVKIGRRVFRQPDMPAPHDFTRIVESGNNRIAAGFASPENDHAFFIADLGNQVRSAHPEPIYPGHACGQIVAVAARRTELVFIGCRNDIAVRGTVLAQIDAEFAHLGVARSDQCRQVQRQFAHTRRLQCDLRFANDVHDALIRTEKLNFQRCTGEFGLAEGEPCGTFTA